MTVVRDARRAAPHACDCAPVQDLPHAPWPAMRDAARLWPASGATSLAAVVVSVSYLVVATLRLRRASR